MTANPDLSPVAPSKLATEIYGPDEDVCTFGAECALTDSCVDSSPALEKLISKYVFPMREDNTQVFFDNSQCADRTLMIVYTKDRHGLFLDVVSVLKALSVRVHRIASGQDDALRLLLNRIEGELVSLKHLSINLDNCVAFWLTDEESNMKIWDDGERMEQIRACIQVELQMPYPRPRASCEDQWHRVTVQRNRADRFSVFCIQTTDRPNLLTAVSAAFSSLKIDVASATIQTFSNGRVENAFFVTKQGFKEPLKDKDIEAALEKVMEAILSVGDPGPNETLWYQTRDGTAALVAEAIFIDEVNNEELACFKFSKFETPNFRGRLPEAPYRPIVLG